LTSITQWIQQLAQAPLSERGAMLEALVTVEFRARLLMDESDLLPFNESFFALGLTSIGAVEIQQRLEAVLGRRIDATHLFNNPTINHLLAHVRSQVLADLFVSAPAPKVAEEVASKVAGAPHLDPAEVNATTPGAQRSSPKELFNHLLDELYES
jgi:acyl carrier protein